jgi:hypothetical protein
MRRQLEELRKNNAALAVSRLPAFCFLGERHDINTHHLARRPGAGGARIVIAG